MAVVAAQRGQLEVVVRQIKDVTSILVECNKHVAEPPAAVSPANPRAEVTET